MAYLWITEYQKVAFDSVGNAMPVGIEPSITSTVAITGTSTLSPTLDPSTRFVRLNTDSACYVSYGVNPVAVPPPFTKGTTFRMAANQTEFFGLSPGLLIAVLAGV